MRDQLQAADAQLEIRSIGMQTDIAVLPEPIRRCGSSSGLKGQREARDRGRPDHRGPCCASPRRLRRMWREQSLAGRTRPRHPHCERSDEAIQGGATSPWIASSLRSSQSRDGSSQVDRTLGGIRRTLRVALIATGRLVGLDEQTPSARLADHGLPAADTSGAEIDPVVPRLAPVRAMAPEAA